jgi:hypothetical protein
MIGLNIDVPQRDIDNLNSAFKRFVEYYGGNVKKAVEKTMVQIIKSLSGSTKVSSKKRPIVRNPDPRHKTDARMAPLGVFKYSQKKDPRKYFSPIRGTGEYGAAIRYLPGNKVLMRVRNAWEVFSREELESMQMGDRTIQNHKKRIIGRSGLAKSSWSWMLGKLGASMAAKQSEIRGTVGITRINDLAGASQYFGILSENRLNYIRKALIGGRQPVETVLARATNNMRSTMGEIGPRAAKSAGLRAA